MLLSGLDLNRGVKGRRVSNWLLDFKQCSFTHIVQVLGLQLWYTISQFVPFPTCFVPAQGFPRQ
jgi:hypothetical protein